MRLDGKVTVISGGARGIGEAVARRFVHEGARVVLGDILEAPGRALAAGLAADRGAAVFVRLDVTSEADWAAAVATARSRFGRLDVLVNNAGINIRGPLHETSLADWNQVMAVNATGVFLGSRAAVRQMLEGGGGAIVNISSQLALVGADFSSPQYQASKAAVHLLTKHTAVQYAKQGIRANSVHPGPIATPMTAEARADPARYRLMVSRIPLGRYGEPDEIAAAVLYLASDESSFVTGAELIVDGGWTAI